MKKIKNKDKKIISGVVVVLLIVIALWTRNDDVVNYIEQNYDISLNINGSNNENTVDVNSDVTNNNELDFPEYEVVRVVDGDTIVVNYNGNEEKVRLIGVDTPESVHPNESKNTEDGIKTSNYTKERLEGKIVKIELDVQERDKYGRILAYVYIDDKMYNKELLEIGYAKVATYPPNVKYVEDFAKIQAEAKENKMGLWQ